ncbi:hypothetical protein HDV00_002260 [Rhizophlyctis rosea]|nr:hypothetical protein HDV00_002260 [Rhizophlyctis rosea]
MGMSAGEMVAAWSALYSGSLRGLEDLVAGFSPIAVILMIVLVAEVVVLGSVGNLVVKKDVGEVRDRGNVTGMGMVNSGVAGFDVGDAADLVTSHLGALSEVGWTDRAVVPRQWLPSENATCDDSTGICSYISWVTPTPFNVSLFPTLNLSPPTDPVTNDTPTFTPQIPSFLPNDTITMNTTLYAINTTCRPSPTLQLNYYLTYRTYWQVTWTSSNNATKLRSDGAVMPTKYKSPEIGVFQMVNASAATMSDLYYVRPGGELTFAVYARNFQGQFEGFTYVADPVVANTTVGLALCTISARKGYGMTAMRIKDVAPTITSTIFSVTNVTFDETPIFDKTLSGFAPTQIVGRAIGQLSCVFWSCPTRGGIPWFDRRYGIIDRVPMEPEEWNGQLGRMATVLSGAAGRVLAALSVMDAAEAYEYQILNEGLSHTLIILLLGSLSSLLLLFFYALYALLPPRKRSLHLGIRATESIYSLLSSFEAPIIHARTGSNEPTVVKKALKNHVVMLAATGGGHMGVDALDKGEVKKVLKESRKVGGASLAELRTTMRMGKEGKEKEFVSAGMSGMALMGVSTKSAVMQPEESGESVSLDSGPLPGSK